MTVMNADLPFLVDTGARYSTVNKTMIQPQISGETVEVRGFSGKLEHLPLTHPLTSHIPLAEQTFSHQYIASPHCPVNLMGRDILVKTGASILCSADGLLVTFPNGQTFNCSLGGVILNKNMLLSTDVSPTAPGSWADIYWGLLEPSDHGIGALYQMWRPWIHSLEPCAPPLDPLHLTLKYDRDGDEIYQEAFSKIEGQIWEVQSPFIYIGKEGVAAVTDLLNDTHKQWYDMSEEAVPHITLAILAQHQAKDLGPMCRKLHSLTDWGPTQIPSVQFSPSSKTYRIIADVPDSMELEHRQIERFHGREKMDHHDSDALLRSLPESLWSSGPTDVGFCSHVTPVTFKLELRDREPVRRLIGVMVWQMA